MKAIVDEALRRWAMEDAQATFIAGRENQVYKVSGLGGDYALRIRRPGLRSEAELGSELAWLAALERAGLSVPRPEPSAFGALLERIEGHYVDMVGWLSGTPLGRTREPLTLPDPPAAFRALGKQMARLHTSSDAFAPAEGFTRIRWDAAGLVGDAPLWGRFWENPTLDAPTRDLLIAFRAEAAVDLEAEADFGLIHADLVRENVLIDGARLHLIDFDDGGYGYRLFDIATALLKNRAEPAYPALQAALIEGYRAERPLDTTRLDLFLALRAVTYVGWIVPRMKEDGSPARNARFIADARELCAAYLGQRARA